MAVRALTGFQRVVQATAHGKVALLGEGFFRQGQFAVSVLGGHVAHVVSGAPVGFGDHFDVGRAQQVHQPLHGFRQAFLVLDLRHVVVVFFNVGDLHHQHGVVGGQGAAAFGEDVRVRQALRVAEFLEHTDDDAGVIVHVVVDRAGITRVSTVVVHAQAAADVDVVHRQAEVTQFAVITNGFLEPVLVVGQVGDLRAHVEVQQTNALIEARRAEALDHRQQLRRRQTELGLLATRVRPFARRQRRQTHAQANLRLDLEVGGFFDHQANFGFFLDHDENIVTQLLAHQRQADELTVFVTVADDGATLGCQGQHSQQLRLGTGFQADGNVLGGDDVLDHRFLLVHFDRVQRGVLALVFQALDIGIESAGQLAYTVLQDIGKTHQQRQGQTAFAQLVDLLVQIDGRAVRAVRTDFNATGIIDREIPGPPMANPVNTAAVRNCPLAAIVFACASYGHRSPLYKVEDHRALLVRLAKSKE